MAYTDDFQSLLRSIQRYTIERCIPPVWISGWEIEDGEILPPTMIRENLLRVPARLEKYAYINSLHSAKEHVAACLQHFVTIDGQDILPENVAVVPSSTQALLLILTAYRDLLDIHRLFICAPSYFAFSDIANHLGMKPIVIPSLSYFHPVVPVDRLKEKVGVTKQGVVLTNPAYGVGIERTRVELEALFASLSRDTPVLCDESALGLSWQGDDIWSKIDIPSNVTLIRSLCKVFLTFGRKLSVIVSSPKIIQYIEALAESLVGSIEGNTEDIAKVYIDGIVAWQKEVVENVDGPWRAWKESIVRRLKTNLRCLGGVLSQAGFELSQIQSSYYVLAGQRRKNFKLDSSEEILRLTGTVYTWSDGFQHRKRDTLGFRVNLAGNSHQMALALKRSLPLMLK